MTAAPTVAHALDQARSLELDRLDAQLLVGHVLQRPRTWVLAHGEAGLDASQHAALTMLLARRAAGEPMAYLLGRREFHGLDLHITPAVLDPRPDTETLVDWALALLAAWPKGAAPRVLDLGTGSGAIALAIKQAWPAAQVSAVDASTAALAVAQANGERLGLDVEWLAGSWWAPVAGRQFDLLLSNPPYIAEGDPHLAGLVHEPRQALVSGADGLDDIRTLIGASRTHLGPGGWLLLEHGWDQHARVAALFAAAGYAQIEHRTDLGGQIRCTGAR